MKVDLKLLAGHLSRREDEADAVWREVNSYLVHQILLPCMDGTTICLCDIDFDAFDAEDVEALEETYHKKQHQAYALKSLKRTMDGICPVAAPVRAFC